MLGRLESTFVLVVIFFRRWFLVEECSEFSDFLEFFWLPGILLIFNDSKIQFINSRITKIPTIQRNRKIPENNRRIKMFKVIVPKTKEYSRKPSKSFTYHIFAKLCHIFSMQIKFNNASSASKMLKTIFFVGENKN